MSITVSVKWGKQVYNDLELDTEGDILTFKCQLYALTNVPVEKQKIMAKGKILKDEASWSDYPAVKNGIQFMLMGTAEGKELKAPEKQIKFVEDMTPEEKAKALKEKLGIVIPAGLENLGNTCYMNSVLQCIKRVDELKDGLKEFEPKPEVMQEPHVFFTKAASNVMKDMDTKGEGFAPEEFVSVMRQVFPQFDEVDEKTRHHKQQDAEEAYSQFLSAFQYGFNNAKKEDAEMAEEGKDPNLVSRLFGIELENTTKNTENEEEEAKVSKEQLLKLPCHIDNHGNPVNSMGDGLEISLTGEVEKFSESLQRNAVYKKTSKINKLPSYLTVQFVRFYWKKESNVGGTKAGKAKILRSVIYPRVFDAYSFCSDSLKAKLDEGRAIETRKREEEDKIRLEGKMKEAEESDKMLKGQGQVLTEEQKEEKRLVGKAAKIKAAEDEQRLHDENLYRPHGQGVETGNYELVGVVTHKGRSADGGHYVGWVHASGDQWLQFDDDIVTTIKTDDILSLRGGGDWHTAYLCIYRKLEVLK